MPSDMEISSSSRGAGRCHQSRSFVLFAASNFLCGKLIRPALRVLDQRVSSHDEFWTGPVSLLAHSSCQASLLSSVGVP